MINYQHAHSSPRFTGRTQRKTASTSAAQASYDLILAVLIIIAGSQGIYRFGSPLVLWIAVYAMVGLKLATHFRSILIAIRENLGILAYPAIALISTIWSVEPAHSAYSAVQLLVTYLAGFWIGWRYSPNTITLIVVISLSPLILLSLVNWMTGVFGQVYSDSGGLLGVFGNKNTLGRMSLLVCLATLSLYIVGTQSSLRRIVLIVFLTMAVLTLVMSKSATSLIVFLGAIGLFLALTVRHYSAGTRLTIAISGVIIFLAFLALYGFGDFDPTGSILELFGKSSNLTGRTSLWGIAMHQIGTHPWLGVGFDAYWDSDKFRAVESIQLRFGEGLISFHNFILDIWVGTGILGLLGISLTIGTIAFQYLLYFNADRSVDGATMITILLAAVGVALFNPLLFAQHGNMIVILVAFSVSARFNRILAMRRRKI